MEDGAIYLSIHHLVWKKIFSLFLNSIIEMKYYKREIRGWWEIFEKIKKEAQLHIPGKISFRYSPLRIL